MAPKALSSKLSQLVPSQEELDQARKLLEQADKAKKASIKAGMKHYLSSNPDEHISDAKSRESFLLNFL
eukprot:5179284-Pyramimonas_sp.AAC.1